jgi:hypothetical protein
MTGNQDIQTRDEFIKFLRGLCRSLKGSPGLWQNKTVDQYLHGILGFVEDAEGYYSRTETDINVIGPQWGIFADILLAGRVYE